MSKKAKSLKYQLSRAVDLSLRVGASKRSYKLSHRGQTDDLIFTSTYLHEIVNKAAAPFALWMKETHPEVKLAKDLRADFFQEYITERSSKVAPTTLAKEQSYLNKLMQCCDKNYHSRLFEQCAFTNHTTTEAFQHTQSMGSEDAERVVEAMRSTGRSNAWMACELSRIAGLRARESVNFHIEHFHAEGGRYGYGYIDVLRDDKPKHGKERRVDLIRSADRDSLVAMIGSRTSGILAIKFDGGQYTEDGVSKALGRAYQRLGMDMSRWKGNKQHALRKGFAQASYDLVRDSGAPREEALQYANLQLGHERGDDATLNNRYIANQW